MNIKPIVLAGGGGTRLWPASRPDFPKPFLHVTGENSLFAQTLKRITDVSGQAPVTVVCGEAHQTHVARELEALGMREQVQVLVEPAMRNTAPAILFALLTLGDGDDVVGVFPSDHLIGGIDAFRSDLERACDAARHGHVVTFGIKPTRAETGFGYMEVDWNAEHPSGLSVLRYVEKPDLERARRLLASDRFFWNSGMFVFRRSTMMDAFARFQKDLLVAMQGFVSDRSNVGMYAGMRNISVDKAVMERLEDVKLIPASFAWDDLGSWTAVHEANAKDAAGNVVVGDAELRECENATIVSAERFVAGLGLRDTIVVDTPDALLVAARGHVQQVGNWVDELRRMGRSEVDTGCESRRDWGRIRLLEDGQGRTIRTLEVHPGKSLQVEAVRQGTKTWVVASGDPHIRVGTEEHHPAPGTSLQLPADTPIQVLAGKDQGAVIVEVWIH